jgi:2-methylisocitrate lyase-like PEP mutase family enzyme
MTPVTHFLQLHVPGKPLLLPNPWDIGSARVLESVGFRALATTSSGFAATLGRPDYSVSRDEAVAHAAAIAAAVDVPVSADLENCFADEPDGVADTVRLAAATGLAGCSVEDATGRADDPVYDLSLATERVAAAVAAAGDALVITARAENHLHGRDDLADTIARLQAFADAGAHVLYAPGLRTPEQIRTVLAETDRPLNVLAMAGVPTVAELADLGVARVSVGGAFAFAAFGALADFGREFLERGTYGFQAQTKAGKDATDAAFNS